jgi:hypothetical protein
VSDSFFENSRTGDDELWGTAFVDGRLDKHAGEAVGGLGCLEDIRTCDDELLGTALVGSEGPFKT